jgi:hypothetical protein
MGNDQVMAGPHSIAWVLATSNPIPPVSLDSVSMDGWSLSYHMGTCNLKSYSTSQPGLSAF